VVVASPLQVSAEQNFARLRLFLPEHEAVKSWSDAGSTTHEAIERALESDGERVFISTTFETLHVVAACLRAKREVGFTIVIDEAYNLPTYTGNSGDSDDGDADEGGGGDSYEANGESDVASAAAEKASDDSVEASDDGVTSAGRSWDTILSPEKVFLMTATPLGSLLETNGNIGLAHRYTFAEAVTDKAICDYRVYIPYISCDESGGGGDGGIDCDTNCDDNSIAAKAKFLGLGMLESGARRSIVYLASRKECRQFEEAFRLA
jgi:hypothetical protein